MSLFSKLQSFKRSHSNSLVFFNNSLNYINIFIIIKMRNNFNKVFVTFPTIILLDKIIKNGIYILFLFYKNNSFFFLIPSRARFNFFLGKKNSILIHLCDIPVVINWSFDHFKFFKPIITNHIIINNDKKCFYRKILRVFPDRKTSYN